MTTLDCQIIEVNPSMAQEMLNANSHNRTLRKDYVQKLAAAMQRGEWTINGEPVQIAADGTLLNGQHRLSAVVESGVSVPLLIIRGLEVRSQITMDSGRRRNLSDVLALHGESETANLAAMLAMLHRYRREHRLDNSGRTAPTPAQALALLEAEPGIKKGIPLARRVTREAGLRTSVAALLTYLFNEADPPEGDRFFEALCNADEEPTGSPVVALKSILDRSRNEPTYQVSSYVLYGMVIKAFNAWREGRDIYVLSFRPGGPNPDVFPKIIPGSEISRLPVNSRH